MKILFLLNTIEGINVWRRASILGEMIKKKRSDIDIRLISRGRSRGYDLVRYSKFLLENRGHIVHIFEPFFPTFPILYPLLKAFKAPIIYDTGDLHFAVSRVSGDLFARYAALRFFEDLAFHFSNIIAARGRGLKEILERIFNVDPYKIFWVPDGVDLVRFAPRDVRHIREKLDLEDKIVIGYASDYRPVRIGDLQLSRGWELIHIGRRLIDSGYKDFALLMVGRGKAIDHLKKMAVDLGVKDHVVFTGFVPDELYPYYINAMDICFYESLDDLSYHAMTGTKMQEYMASGKPIVAGEIGEAKYVLKNAGILVKPLKPDKRDIPRYLSDITRAMLLLLEDESLRKELGRAARRKAEEHYDWFKIAEKLLQIYLSLI